MRRSRSIRISRRPTRWRRGAISGARSTVGWAIECRRSPRAPDWPVGPSSWGQDDAVALTRSGHALGHLAADLDGGIALIDKALLINPNLAAAWSLGGFLRLLNGVPDAAPA